MLPVGVMFVNDARVRDRLLSPTDWPALIHRFFLSDDMPTTNRAYSNRDTRDLMLTFVYNSRHETTRLDGTHCRAAQTVSSPAD